MSDKGNSDAPSLRESDAPGHDQGSLHLGLRWSRSTRTVEAAGSINGRPYWSVDGLRVAQTAPAQADEYPRLEISRPLSMGGEPRRTLPGMEVDGGEIRLQIDDLIPFILERIEAADLAETLCSSQEVRERILECLAKRWLSDNLADVDRRKFLAEIKETVHSAALDRLTRHVAGAERAATRLANEWAGRVQFNLYLRGHECKDRNGKQLEIELPPCPFDTSIQLGAGSWAEAREHWRTQTAELFALSTAERKDGSSPPQTTEVQP